MKAIPLLAIPLALVTLVAVLLVVFFYDGGSRTRLVLQVHSRGEFVFSLQTPLTHQPTLSRKKAALTDAVLAALGKDALGAEVELTKDAATIFTAASTKTEAAIQLKTLTAAVRKVLGTAATPPQADKVFRAPDEAIMAEVCLIMLKRIDPYGDHRVRYDVQGQDRIMLEFPDKLGIDRVQRLITPQGDLRFLLLPQCASVSEDDNGKVTLTPPTLLRSNADPTAETLKASILIIRGSDLEPKSMLTCDQQGKPAISFSIKRGAAEHFGAVTGSNIGRYLVIMLDERILVAPVIQGRITDRGIITGNFAAEEARDLAGVLNAGELPLKVTVVESTPAP